MTGGPDHLTSALGEKKRRQFDALRLFRPLPTHLPALKSRASELLIRGGNRSGKSILGGAITASVARNLPIVGLDGAPLPRFINHDRPKLIWVIGKGEAHIGQTLHRLLFEPGIVPLFKDPNTRLVRAARNYLERELGRQQRLASSPFIPKSEIASIAWKDAAEKHFSVITLHNGTRICAFTSSGDVKMGDPVDFIWIDEDLQYPKYVAEWQARLSDTKGRLLWTAWPWQSNYSLVQMSNRAKEEAAKKSPDPDVFEVVLRFSDNPFIDDEEKRKRRAAWSFGGTAELKSRDEGDFMTDQVLMYPNYHRLVHGCGREGVSPDKLEQAMLYFAGQPPFDWTRYLCIDPGHACTAILFLAVPPPQEFGDVVVLFDELYLSRYDADQCAKAVKNKLAGHVFSEFIIDGRIARETSIGVGKTYYQIYQEAFQRHGLRSVMNGCGFTFSSDDVSAGIMAVRTWLSVRSDGTAKLRVAKDMCPGFEQEIAMYRKQVTKDEIHGDKPANGQADHAMDVIRYLAMHGCEWRPPVDAAAFQDPGGAYRLFQQLWQGGDKPQASLQTVYLGAGTPRAA